MRGEPCNNCNGKVTNVPLSRTGKINSGLWRETMTVFNAVTEMFEGMKLGARYTISKNHRTVERAVQPRVSPLNTEGFGR